jgi:hypothetical protein
VTVALQEEEEEEEVVVVSVITFHQVYSAPTPLQQAIFRIGGMPRSALRGPRPRLWRWRLLARFIQRPRHNLSTAPAAAAAAAAADEISAAAATPRNR